MIVHYILSITLVGYAILASQSFMYLLSLKAVQLKLDAKSYITLRKYMDQAMNVRLRYALYGTLAFNVLLVAASATNPSSIIFITALLALVTLVADILLALKGNIPLNKLINTWSTDRYPENWTDVRAQWLAIFQYRQVALITGLVSLVIGAVFR
jgi:hypothetical protein